jgi:hypothetical protein
MPAALAHRIHLAAAREYYRDAHAILGRALPPARLPRGGRFTRGDRRGRVPSFLAESAQARHAQYRGRAALRRRFHRRDRAQAVPDRVAAGARAMPAA